MNFTELKVAVVCWRLGPYHHARLNAAGRRMKLFGIETCGIENTNAWAIVEGAGSFQRVTLTERHVPDRRWRQELERRMIESLDELKPQVVAIPGWSLVDALVALRWCSRTRTPVIVMSDSTALDAPRVAWKEKIKQRLVGLCSSALVAGSRHRDYLVTLGMPVECTFAGYDVVDNEYFEQNSEQLKTETLKAEARSKHGLPEKFFLASARFLEKKNLPRLLEAFARYRQLATASAVGGPVLPWSLVLLGDGPLRETLSQQVATLNLQPFVRQPGFKQYSDLPAHYGCAAAFIHASTTDQWGLVVNEAMAAGLPVLVSNRCGCAPDLVREGVNGFTFDPYDVEQLAQLMLKISTMECGDLSPFFAPADLSARLNRKSEILNRKSAAPSTTLAQMGDASRAIIANWGPERFASGLMSAAEQALSVGPKPASVFDRLLLRGLISRGTAE